MPRRPLQALVFAVLVGVTPLTSIAAPVSQVAPLPALYQEEWVQDANGEWVPAETWTDPATNPVNPDEAWVDPAVGGEWSDPSAAETATWALFLWTGFIDGELTTTEIGAIQFFCCGLRLIGGAHGDERETAGAAGHLVHGDVNIGHGTELPKC